MIPVLKDGAPRFIVADLRLLELLLNDDFGGFTKTMSATAPVVSGTFIGKTGTRYIDQHVVYEVYARQTDDAQSYFEELARQLEAYSREVIAQRLARYRGEEQILIDLSTVTIL